MMGMIEPLLRLFQEEWREKKLLGGGKNQGKYCESDMSPQGFYVFLIQTEGCAVSLNNELQESVLSLSVPLHLE